MKLPKLAIENYQFTIIMIALLTIAGVISFLTMPRSEDPQVAPAGSSVIVIYPGASPEDMERLIVDPIEESINELEDIKKFNTIMKDGLAVMQVEFHSGTDPDDKYSDIVQKVNRIRPSLPDEIMSLDLLKWQISNVNIVQTALISDSAEYIEMEDQAELLKKNLERVPGIKSVRTWAFPEREVSIAVDLDKAARMNIPLMQIFGAVQSNNSNIPGGSIDIASRKFNIKTSGAYETLQEIENTVIHARSGSPVYLKDIADVKFDYEDQKYFARFLNKKAVFITARQKENTNIFNIMDNIHQRTNKFKTKLPANMELEYVFDQSNSVASRLNVFFSSLFQGMLLVGLVVFIVFGFRASVIISLVIPLSIIIGIGFVDLSGYGLEQMSIAAMVIALGLLVDNAIVITENISRFLRNGHSRFDAAVKATSQVAWPVISSTVTTILAFIPIIFMQNITGDFIRSMPVTVVYTLLASLLAALTLTPYLSSKILKIENNNGRGRVNKWVSRLVETEYRRRLDFVLRHRTLTIIIAIVLFASSIMLVPLVGLSFFPKAEKPQFFINVEMPRGTSLDETDNQVKNVESILDNMEHVKLYTANIGRSNPQLYYNVIEKFEQSNFGQLYVELDGIEYLYLTIDSLRAIFAKLPGGRIEIKELVQGPPVEAPVVIKILGNNLTTIKNISKDIENIIKAAEGTINVNNPLSTSAMDLKVNINRDKAGIYGLSVADIDRTVRVAITGATVSKFRDDEGKEFNMVIRLPIKEKPEVSDFSKIYLTSAGGAQVPLLQVANIEFAESPSQISHYKLERNVTITADVQGDYSVDQVTKKIIGELDNYEWPAGYKYYAAGELESREESFGGMGQAVIVAIIAIFGVLVLQFRSFSQPLIVFSAIPLAIFGSIIALLITGNTFSFTAFIGITSLVGIVINNSIILVDYTNKLRDQGKDIVSALKEAGETRFMPIILTTATTVGGLLPLTLGGGSLWAPMGWTIIGGLTFSTFLTLLVVPVLYRIYTPEAALASTIDDTK